VRVLTSVLFFVMFLAAQYGFGNLLIKLCIQNNANKDTVGVGVKIATGQVFTSIFLLPFAIGSKFNGIVIITTTIIGASAAYLLTNRREALSQISRIPNKLKPTLKILEIMTLLILLAPQVVRLMGRPISDALAYYLVQPKLIALTHQLTVNNGYDAFLQSSAFLEINNAAVFMYTGEIGMRAYLALSGIVLFRVVWEICQQFQISQFATKIVLFLLATSTFITNTLADGKTDNVSTLWFMAAFSIYVLSLNQWNKKPFVLFGVILSAAVLSKISFLVLMPALVYFFFIEGGKRPNKKKILAAVCIVTGMGLPILVNSIKNLIVFSDPLVPFVSRLTNQDTQLFTQEWFSSDNTKWIVISYPLAILFGQYPMQYGNLTPFIFLGLPILFKIKNLDRVDRKKLLNLAVMAASSIFLWVLLKPSVIAPRYISPAFIFLIIVFGFLASKNLLRIQSFKIKMLIATLITGHLIFVNAQAIVTNDLSFYSGSRNPESLMYKYVSKIPKGSGLIFLDTFNASMLDNASLQCSSVVHPFTARNEPTSDRTIWDDLYEQGFRFVISDKTTHRSLNEMNMQSGDGSDSVVVDKLIFSNSHILYSLTSKSVDNHSKQVEC
jgi:hypothetical protein